MSNMTTLNICAMLNSQSDANVATNDPQHILANAERASNRVRSLKHGDTFAVFDHHGDIRPAATGEDGLYYDGTRFLSGFVMDLNRATPMLLGSTVRDDNDQLVVNLTNSDLFQNGELYLAASSIHISRKIFLFEATCYSEIKLENYAFEAAEVVLSLRYCADFMDIYEVRGMSRKKRGIHGVPEVESSAVTLHYEGLDGEARSTHIAFDKAPTEISKSQASYKIRLEPGASFVITTTIACQRALRGRAKPLEIDKARVMVLSEIHAQKSNSCCLTSSNGQFNALMDRALSDLHMMITPLATGPYPYAGVPWFNTPFGRDGLITAWECLWMRPDLARGVLAYLAATQATDVIAEQDAEPGKILHETRSGEMAALKEMPYGRYYGSVDATPLFVALAGAYYERTGDIGFIEEIWPNINAALEWMTLYGDKDGDGFLEYQRSSADGLIHQGWKDADDAVFHWDGSTAEGAIALCEVQGYAYAAFRAAAKLAHALRHKVDAIEFVRKAERLRNRFNDEFWCEEMSMYVMALDGDKRQCCVVSSNAGQCLFTGIATPRRATLVAEKMLSKDCFSGWGVRTISSSEARFNPMSYHNGSVWPHDNALIAYGMAQYGLGQKSAQVFEGLFGAAMYFDLHRMPELFCGFSQEAGGGPVLYPVACAPQAWSAASLLMLFQACLGIHVDGIKKQVILDRPTLPSFLKDVRITNLQVEDATLDFDVAGVGDDVSVTVKSNVSNIPVVIMK